MTSAPPWADFLLPSTRFPDSLCHRSDRNRLPARFAVGVETWQSFSSTSIYRHLKTLVGVGSYSSLRD
jgi:hypothetical protein